MDERNLKIGDIISSSVGNKYVVIARIPYGRDVVYSVAKPDDKKQTHVGYVGVANVYGIIACGPLCKTRLDALFLAGTCAVYRYKNNAYRRVRTTKEK